jgi:XTP/dITP diphosphohydrolase
MQQIVLASNNNHKIREIGAILTTTNITLHPQNKFNIPEIAETGLTFVENAILKARNAAKHANLPALADDSGLVIDALNGEPGIYSARYAGINAGDQANVEKVLAKMQHIPEHNRSAHFYCVIVYLRNAFDPNPIIGQGTWNGNILHKPQGKNGFGYDPLFLVPNYNCSAAELPSTIKNQFSHRGQALKQLMTHFA